MTQGEFAFYLAPSKVHGVGVFAAHRIKKGVQLKLFWETSVPRKRVPALFKRYCVHNIIGDWSPRCFGRMSVGWYLNHSKNANTIYDETHDTFFSAKQIEAGEEVTVDYLKAGFGKP